MSTMSSPRRSKGTHTIPSRKNKNPKVASDPSDRPCHHWRMLGVCPFGTNCKYQHAEGEKGILQARLSRTRREGKPAREKAEKEGAMREQMKARREQEATIVEQYIVSESSLITCSAGLHIEQVVSGFDLCRITIRNLPSNAKFEEIADIFRHQGVASTEFFVLEIKPVQNRTKCEAVVAANVDQGQNIAIGLEGIEFRNEILTFEVSENASWNGMAPTAAQNAPFITVSWWAPSETIVATYTSDAQAREQVQRLNGKIWNGRRIRAMLSDRPIMVSLYEVRILGCAAGTSRDAEFCTFVGTYSVRLVSQAKYSLHTIFIHVRDHLSRLPGVQMDTYEVLNKGTDLDAEARIKIGFDDWEDAKRAHDRMDGQRLISTFPMLRSWLPKPLQYSIKIPRQQFQAQKVQWDELSEKRPDRNAHVQTKPGERGDVVFIRVLGQDKKAAGSLKVRIEGLVAGEKLDAAVHWHPSFTSPKGKLFLDRVFSEKQVFVRTDLKMRCLRVCGEPAKIERAKKMIREEVERLAGMETTRVLDQACVRGFMRKGLGKLKELIGDDNVTVNVASRPYIVTVKGGAEATHHLQRLIEEARAMGGLDKALPGDDAEKRTCPICTDDVSNGEQLGCGHAYCSGCLSHFLTSAIDNKNFPLVCMGNAGQCRVPISIPSIRRFLPHQLFENLVEAAFMAYLERHPQELKYCTTPDCKQIYRRRSDKTLLKCPACFSSICPGCDEEAHEGMTCEERRIHRDPALHDRLNEEFARESGFKKCPQCSVFIEKTYGCNHMTCRCGANICWKCMGVFTADTVYAHLNSAHGGIHDEIPGGADPMNVDDMAAQVREFERIEREQRAQAANCVALARQQAWNTQCALQQEALEDRRREEEIQARIERWGREQEQARQERAIQEARARQDLLAAQRRPEEKRGWCVVM